MALKFLSKQNHHQRRLIFPKRLGCLKCNRELANCIIGPWLGPGVAGLDVSDPGFDIDAAIDARGGADPSITGTAGTVNNNFVAR